MKTLPIVCLLLALAQPASAQSTAPADGLAMQDLRVAALAQRLFAANDALCRSHMPLTGLVLHSRDQYGPAEAQARFGDARVAVALIVPGSAAERAGLRAGDAITSIGGIDMATVPAPDGGFARDAAFALLADGGQVAVQRETESVAPILDAPTGCRGLAEVRIGKGRNARTDGRIIQVDYGLAAMADDSLLAVVFAHEFAHLVLDHHRRLQQAGVAAGFLAQFGRNGRMNRQMEDEADRLSVHLLANAGFDPAIAPAAWRSAQGRNLAGGALRSRTHGSATARAELLEREIAVYLGGPLPSSAAHLLALRDE